MIFHHDYVFFSRSQLFGIIKIKRFFAFRAKVIRIFNNPLTETIHMKCMMTRQYYSLCHISKTNHAGCIMKLGYFLMIELLEIFHSLSKFLNFHVAPSIIVRVLDCSGKLNRQLNNSEEKKESEAKSTGNNKSHQYLYEKSGNVNKYTEESFPFIRVGDGYFCIPLIKVNEKAYKRLNNGHSNRCSIVHKQHFNSFILPILEEPKKCMSNNLIVDKDKDQEMCEHPIMQAHFSKTNCMYQLQQRHNLTKFDLKIAKLCRMNDKKTITTMVNIKIPKLALVMYRSKIRSKILYHNLSTIFYNHEQSLTKTQFSLIWRQKMATEALNSTITEVRIMLYRMNSVKGSSMKAKTAAKQLSVCWAFWQVVVQNRITVVTTQSRRSFSVRERGCINVCVLFFGIKYKYIQNGME